MQINIAVGGCLPENKSIFSKLDEISARLCSYVPKGESAEITMIISPEYSGGCWKEYVKERGFHLTGCMLSSDSEDTEEYESVVSIESSVRTVIGSNMCGKADILILVWNEDIRELNGATWELIQEGQRTDMPCVWISSKTEIVYWAEESCFEHYMPEHLDDMKYIFETAPVSPDKENRKNSPFISLGSRLRASFLKKYKAENVEINADKDVVLKEDYCENEMPDSDKLRKKLVESYRQYDSAAIEYSSKYNTVMYWRAILPFITTIFLGIGFYIKAVFKLMPIWNDPVENIADFVAGVGFLIHGIMNVYVYYLSKNSDIHRWHSRFIDTRYIAEMLRVISHLEPYGISLDIRKLSGNNKNIYATVRDIIRKNNKGRYSINRKNVGTVYRHIIEMTEDQINYHRISAEKYRRITENMNRWYRRIFIVGFVSVLLRAVLQFIMAFKDFNIHIMWIGLDNSLINSLANMVAMMVPAWAAYFMSKISQCSYSYNYENHRRMEHVLTEELERLKYINELESTVQVEALMSISENLADAILVSDTEMWHAKIKSSSVKPL